MTVRNRKHCVTLGRTMYICIVQGKKYIEISDFVIRPRLVEKTWYVCDGVKTYIHTGETREQYAESFDEVITYFIKEKKLYIDTNKKLATFE